MKKVFVIKLIVKSKEDYSSHGEQVKYIMDLDFNITDYFSNAQHFLHEENANSLLISMFEQKSWVMQKFLNEEFYGAFVEGVYVKG